MPPSEKGDSLPSYEESVQPPRANPQRIPHSAITRTASPSRGQQIMDQLTTVRAQHLRSIIDSQIIPVVEAQANFGLAHTTIAMIPSDVKLPPPSEKSEYSFSENDYMFPSSDTSRTVEVIGFSSDEEPQIVRLEGQMNRVEFWRPQAIVSELERTLHATLNSNPNLISPSPPRNVHDLLQRSARRSFLGRFADSLNQDSGGTPESEVRANERERLGGQVLIKARLEEICLRTVSEFGLYDTMTKQCVIIRVDARC